MSHKTLGARIKQKRDSDINWENNNPILLNGEIILVDTTDSKLRLKIGNGTSTYIQLPFLDEDILTEISNLSTDLELYTDTQIAALVNSAPETLDTLGELATAFEENQDMVATLNEAITYKANQTDLQATQELVDTNMENIFSLQSQVLLNSLIMADAITGDLYKIQIQNGQLVSFPVGE